MELVENMELNNNNFFETTFGRIINNSIETGLKSILPDFIENDVINIKNTLVNEGFSEAVNETINTAINFGKSVLGIFTGNFENIDQVENAIEKGGVIDGISNALDYVLDKIKVNNIIPNEIINIIKDGKNVILNDVSTNIKEEFSIQNDNINKLEKYNKKWREAYSNKDFESMEKNYKKINNYLQKIMPLENILKEAHTIESLHYLIKNNGQNFDITPEEQELIELLTQ